jgi:exonuclease SbcC
MIPVYLEMNAFGPYASKQIIDFRLLGDRKLFLIYGPTGAGKTTILDAICFALYGDTSGNTRSGSHMRSEYAPPEETTYVHFSFAIGTKQYRVERMPEQYIAKKRGTGMKHAASAAVLYEVSSDGEDLKVLATKNVNDEIIHLLGFKSEQFRQVVLLPQGDFRKLLLASSSERQQIMQILFHTQRYANLQVLAKSRHDEVAEAYSTMQDRISFSLQAVHMENEETLAASLQTVEKQAAETTRQITQAFQERDMYQKVVQQAQVLDSHWQALEQVRARKQKLEGQQDMMQQQRAYAAVLRQAQLLAEPCQHIDDIQLQGTNAGEKAKTAAKAAATAAAELADARKACTAWEAGRTEQQQRIDTLAQLQAMTEKAKEYGNLTQTAASAEKETTLANGKLTVAANQLETWKEQAETARKTLDGQAQLLAEWERAKARVKAVADRVQQEVSIETLTQTLTESKADCAAATKRLAAATLAARTARVDYEAVHTLFLQGQAALLAADLAEGEACPVCGAMDHPQLAVPTADMPQKDDVERHKAAAEARERQRQQAEVKVKSAEAIQQEQQRQYAELRGQYVSDGTSAEWRARLAQAEKKERKLQDHVQRVGKLAATMQALQEQGRLLEQEERQARNRAEEKRIVLARAVEARIRAEADLPEQYRQAGVLQGKMKTLQKEIKAYEEGLAKSRQDSVEAERRCARWNGQEKELARQVKELRRQYTDSMEALKERVVAAGFTSVNHCRNMQAAIPKLEGIQETIDAYDKEMQQVQGQMSQEEQTIAGKSRPDMDEYRNALTAHNERCSTLTEEAARLNNQVSQLRDAAKRIAACRNDQAVLSEQYKTVGAVYDLISGKCTGINFERYVLGTLLDEVLGAANLRLEDMSRHRYVLQRSHNWEDKRVKQVGLDIEVYDNYTGYPRPANTLSGGETFLASLSLALGLADIVQTYSGGIHLDTIFIDEGFGSLDGETLDYALKSLLALQQDGRLVGIISHVPELKERIDTRLAVTKTDRGSTAAFELL